MEPSPQLGGSNTGTQGRVIDATGKHVYPGFIAPTKSLGLVEVDAVRPSDDQDELGEMIPNVRSLIAYNAESKVVESMPPMACLLGKQRLMVDALVEHLPLFNLMLGIGKTLPLKLMTVFTYTGQTASEEAVGG